MNATDERQEPGIPQAPEPVTPQAAGPPPGWTPPPQPMPMDPRRKSPMLACILSLVPGLGQVYIGYYKTGFIHMAVFATTVAILNTNIADAMIPLLAIFLLFFFLYNVVDAGRRANFYNQALAGIDGVRLPEDLSLPSAGGSVAGGMALIIIGVVLLSNTAAGWSLDWLEDWWPLAPILVGAWLLWRGMQERAQGD